MNLVTVGHLLAGDLRNNLGAWFAMASYCLGVRSTHMSNPLNCLRAEMLREGRRHRVNFELFCICR